MGVFSISDIEAAMANFVPIMLPSTGLCLMVLLMPVFVMFTLVLKMVACSRSSLRTTECSRLTFKGCIRTALIYLVQNSWWISIMSLVVALLLTINFAAYAYQNLQLGLDITYYLKVNVPAYDVIGAIDLAQGISSFAAVLSSSPAGSSRRLLSSSSSTENVALVYHDMSWANVITADRLQAICNVERSLLQDMSCFDISKLSTVLPKIFDMTTCDYLSSDFSYAEYILASPENSIFVQDSGVGGSGGTYRGSIILSYIHMGTCEYEYSTIDEMNKAIGRADQDGIVVTYLAQSYLQKEFIGAALNAVVVSAESFIASIGFAILGLRGPLCAIVTFICVLISAVTSAAFLPDWHYAYFSAFNVMSLYVLVGVGATTVLLFSTSWRVARSDIDERRRQQQEKEEQEEIVLVVKQVAAGTTTSVPLRRRGGGEGEVAEERQDQEHGLGGSLGRGLGLPHITLDSQDSRPYAYAAHPPHVTVDSQDSRPYAYAAHPPHVTVDSQDSRPYSYAAHPPHITVDSQDSRPYSYAAHPPSSPTSEEDSLQRLPVILRQSDDETPIITPALDGDTAPTAAGGGTSSGGSISSPSDIETATVEAPAAEDEQDSDIFTEEEDSVSTVTDDQQQPHISETAELLCKAYNRMGRAALFTASATCIALYSKLASPVVIISQLGAYMGTAYLVFYALFHTVIIPAWIATSSSCTLQLIQKLRNLLLLPITPLQSADMIHGDKSSLGERERKEKGGWYGQISSKIEEGFGGVTGKSLVPNHRSPTSALPGILPVQQSGRSRGLAMPTNREEVVGGRASGTRDDPEWAVSPPAALTSVEREPLDRLGRTVDDRARDYDYGADADADAESKTADRSGYLYDYYRDDGACWAGSSGAAGNQVQDLPGLHSSVQRDTRCEHGQESADVDTRSSVIEPTNTTSDRPTGAAAKPTSTWITSSPFAAFNALIDRAAKISAAAARSMRLPFWFLSPGARSPLAWTSLIIAVALVLTSALIIRQKVTINFGIPQLFPPASNMGQVIVIVQDFKPSILSAATAHSGGSTGTPNNPIKVPIHTAKPSASPTYAPTASSTAAMTYAPTQSPTMAPTLVHNVPPQAGASASETHGQQTTNYMVVGCWGISYHKHDIDGDVQVSWDQAQFESYYNTPTTASAAASTFTSTSLSSVTQDSQSFFGDADSLCAYVDTHREYLDVNPSWNRSRDCIFDQLQALAESSDFKNAETLSNALGSGGGTALMPSTSLTPARLLLLLWAYEHPRVSGRLLGIAEEGGTGSGYKGLPSLSDITSIGDAVRLFDFANTLYPIWVCANFSAQSPTRSLSAHPDFASTLHDRWNHAFQTVGGRTARKKHVPVIVGSTEFTFPLLVGEVLFSMILAGTLAIAGSIFLTFLVTLGDLALTVISTMIMAIILSVTVWIKLFVSVPLLDLLDVFVLVALIGIAADFPIHVILHFNALRSRKLLLPGLSGRQEGNPKEEAAAATTNAATTAAATRRKLSQLQSVSQQQLPPNRIAAVERVAGDIEEQSTEEQPPLPSSSNLSSVEPTQTGNLATNERPSNGGETDSPTSSSGVLTPRLSDIPSTISDTTTVTGDISCSSHEDDDPWGHTKNSAAALTQTVVYMRTALLGPLILIVLLGIPLLFATFTLLQKTGQYLIIMAIVSYAVSVSILPGLLAFVPRAYKCYMPSWLCEHTPCR